MSVTSAMYTGVSGLLSNSEAMNVIGNNISNINTVGFKSSRTIFEEKFSEKLGNVQIGTGTDVRGADLFTQGASQQTTSVTDLMISGRGFFAVADPAGLPTAPAAAYLTRAGAFHLDKDLYLVNPEGYRVLATDGKAVQFDSADFKGLTKIAFDGTLTYLDKDGISKDYTSKIAVVKVPDPSALQMVGGSLYKATSDTGVSGTFADATADGTTEKILSNCLESSTADMAKEFVNLIVTQRAYSANSRTITTADQMMQEVLALVR